MDISKKQVTKWSIGNSLTPIEGPKVIATNLNFGIDTEFIMDAVSVLQDLEKEFSLVQTVYIDLSGTDSALTITVDKSGQKIIAKGRTQGYYPVVCPNLWKLKFACADVLAIVPIQLCNYAVAPGIWAATV